MTDHSFKSIAGLLQNELEGALKIAGIFDIDAHGWLNARDVDPEYAGHAMWQMHGPPAEDLIFFDDKPLPRRPADSERDIVQAGEDFCGMMKASRYSIGMALLWSQEAKDKPMDTGSQFWFHHIDAFLKLEIASDRIRKFLVCAVTGEGWSKYKDKRPTKHHRLYATPFEDAPKWLAERDINDSRLLEPLDKISHAGTTIFGYIEQRNKIVHEVATQWAVHQRDLMQQLRDQYDDEQRDGYSPHLWSDQSWEELSSHCRVETEDSIRKIEDAIYMMRSWYSKLIDLSNDVFVIEYWSRKLQERNDEAKR